VSIAPIPDIGALEIELVSGSTGRTQVQAMRQHFPQRITAPMYLDDQDQGMAFICVQNPTGGTFPGERLSTKVVAHSNTQLHFSTQSATQIYAGEAGLAAEHDLCFMLDENSVMEHFAKTVIPHKNSSYRQETSIRLQGDAVYLGSETIAAGRIGHGERYQYQNLEIRTFVDCDLVPIVRDALVLEPSRRSPDKSALVAGWDYLATFMVLAPKRDIGGITGAFDRLLDARQDCIGASTVLPHQSGVLVRLLADRAPVVQSVIAELWQIARRQLLNRDAIGALM
jgi:urease accessory protein